MNTQKFKKIQQFLVLIGLFVGACFVAAAFYAYQLITPIDENGKPQEFIVEKGMGSAKISHKLTAESLIRSPYAFQFYVWTHGIDSKLLDGVYTLSPAMTISEIASILHSGDIDSNEINLTIIEGWNNRQIAEYLEDKEMGDESDFFAAVEKKQDWWDKYEVLASRPRDRDLEGYIFPDTYRVFKDASMSDIVEKALVNLEQKLTDELLSEIERQGKTIHEILTLASIIEKEVPHHEDMKKVSGIFYNRLAIGMALQADSTVNYVTQKSVSRASAQDLAVDSPYNTYKYPGLPPGPISNPGMDAILAAVYPAEHEYFYFLTTPEGEVIYSITFDEHVKAKNTYY